ncbi:hypothetical protein FF011L_26220 [Roseimaritima multifibrata]|uniref:Uncharacterized protein n=1 Tax=Roseimaritima multifibrata TaxID=1930274 RepID=A0A517MGF7_9BACT|nr:hypothetical protein FF011L_26220 [Roseimaritima multifibrata]
MWENATYGQTKRLIDRLTPVNFCRFLGGAGGGDTETRRHGVGSWELGVGSWELGGRLSSAIYFLSGTERAVRHSL